MDYLASFSGFGSCFPKFKKNKQKNKEQSQPSYILFSDKLLKFEIDEKTKTIRIANCRKKTNQTSSKQTFNLKDKIKKDNESIQEQQKIQNQKSSVLTDSSYKFYKESFLVAPGTIKKINSNQKQRK